MAPSINDQLRMVNFSEHKGVDQNARTPPVTKLFWIVFSPAVFADVVKRFHQTFSIFAGGSRWDTGTTDMTIQIHMVRLLMAETPHSTYTSLSHHSTFTDPTALHLGVASCNPLHRSLAAVGSELCQGFHDSKLGPKILKTKSIYIYIAYAQFRIT